VTEEKDPMPPTEYRTVDIDGLSMFYRSALHVPFGTNSY
jgi:hypothetical protein